MNPIKNIHPSPSGFVNGFWIACISIFLCLSLNDIAVAQSVNNQKEPVEESHTSSESDLSENTLSKQDSADSAVPTEAEQRELGADENPQAVSEIQRDAKAKTEPEHTTGFDIYGSARVRYREKNDEGEWQDASSRLGVEADWLIRPDYYLFARYEGGFNVLARADSEEGLGAIEDTFITRLLYAGMDLPNGHIVAGKNWSPYYEVAAFTDRFEGTGGAASGTFNALTDGGPTGTGRADRAIQSKLSLNFLPHTVFKPFDLNLQLQQGNPIPFGDGADYDTAVTASAVMATRANLSIGLAYNYAGIDMEENPSLQNIGISGSARAVLGGVRAFGDRWYAGLTGARLNNHETTDEGVYFNGWGSEFYGQYRLTDRLWPVGGYNILKPDSDQVQAGDFLISYSVLGLRYSFEDFRRMIWANVRISDGFAADGTPGENVYTIGFRWDMSRRGWHMSR
jgi:outer membrane protein N